MGARWSLICSATIFLLMWDLALPTPLRDLSQFLVDFCGFWK
jgi:hypothetical protein